MFRICSMFTPRVRHTEGTQHTFTTSYNNPWILCESLASHIHASIHTHIIRWYRKTYGTESPVPREKQNRQKNIDELLGSCAMICFTSESKYAVTNGIGDGMLKCCFCAVTFTSQPKRGSAVNNTFQHQQSHVRDGLMEEKTSVNGATSEYIVTEIGETVARRRLLTIGVNHRMDSEEPEKANIKFSIDETATSLRYILTTTC